MKHLIIVAFLVMAVGGCKQQLPQKGDYWLELKNAFGEWERTVLITGYLDDYQACTEFLQAISEWNRQQTAISREYRCTPV